MSPVHVIEHPLVQHKLSLLRDRRTLTRDFRQVLKELAMLMAYEVTRDLALQEVEVNTPLERMRTRVIAGKKLVFVSILRAGTGLLDGMLEVVPNARVGHIGLARDPDSLQALEYCCKLPADLAERDVVLLDPMLATGHSACAAIERLRPHHPRSLKFVCLLACPEGLATLQARHPDVPVYTAAVDRELNGHGYILPGLGDAGDRLFGTR